jgi:DNA-binding NtrC family response regulator
MFDQLEYGVRSCPYSVGCPMKTGASVLLVMRRERGSLILEQLEDCCGEVLAAWNCGEARRVLQTQRPIQIVITDTILPDGSWRDVVEDASHREPKPEVIVCDSHGDLRRRSKVLEAGTSESLMERCRKAEVRRQAGRPIAPKQKCA